MWEKYLRNRELRCMLGLSLLMAIVLYPIGAFVVKADAGFSYIITSLVFALPILVCALWFSKKWMFCVLTILLTMTSLVELTMVDLYGAFLLPGSIISTIWTNHQEASEFFWTNLLEILHWIPLIALCVAACWLYTPCEIRKFGGDLIITICLCLLPIAFITYKLNVSYKKEPITLRYYIDNRVWNRPPYNIFFSSYNAHRIVEQRKMIEHAKEVDFGACRKTEPARKEIYVLAIGESMRYENLSLNGIYPRSTTPRLEQEGNLVLFDNYYAQACLTMFSVPLIITRATPQNFELNYAEPSIIKPFKECGFHTFTIVNTNLLSYETYLSNGCDSLIIVQSDKAVVNAIDSLSQQHDKLFVLCQFVGNHSFYTNYEPEFDIYHPNSNDKGIGYTKEALINAYDNSILYQDYILSSIINVINRDSAYSAFMFVSGHGEIIEEGGGGHGGNCAPSKMEYHVPFIFWCSDVYVQRNPTPLGVARQHKKAKINGDNIFYSACSMAGIDLDSAFSMPTWNVFSTDFEEHKRLILVPDGVNTFNPDK